MWNMHIYTDNSVGLFSYQCIVTMQSDNSALQQSRVSTVMHVKLKQDMEAASKWSVTYPRGSVGWQTPRSSPHTRKRTSTRAGHLQKKPLVRSVLLLASCACWHQATPSRTPSSSSPGLASTKALHNNNKKQGIMVMNEECPIQSLGLRRAWCDPNKRHPLNTPGSCPKNLTCTCA